MKIVENDNAMACELGACRKDAKYTLKFDGLGAYHDVNICGDCLRALGAACRGALKRSGRENCD